MHLSLNLSPTSLTSILGLSVLLLLLRRLSVSAQHPFSKAQRPLEAIHLLRLQSPTLAVALHPLQQPLECCGRPPTCRRRHLWRRRLAHNGCSPTSLIDVLNKGFSKSIPSLQV